MPEKKVVYLLFSLFVCLCGCKKEPATNFKLYRFIDHLQLENIRSSPFLNKGPKFSSELFSPVKSYSLLDLGAGENPYGLKRKMDLGIVEINTLFAPPKSEYRYRLTLPENGVLVFGIGIIRDENSEKIQNSPLNENERIHFLIALEASGRRKIVFQKHLKVPPLKEMRTLNFSLEKVSLPPQKKEVELYLITEGKENVFSFWFNPAIYSQGTKKRNVILISIDTLRPDHLRCYGYKKETSPSIDSLAQDSALFLKTYASSPWTLPSHVSLLTSLSGVNHQVYYEYEKMDPTLLTLADILRQNDFFCSAFTGGGLVSSDYGFSKGFDTYQEGEGGVHNKNSAEQVFWVVSEWLDQNKDKNFFLFIHTYQPHGPYSCPSPFDTMFLGKDPIWRELDLLGYLGGKKGIFKQLSENERQNVIGLYDGEIRYTDEMLIKPLIEKLKKMNLYDQTMIIFTSDHGEEFYDHGAWDHGHNLYDETLKVPLTIKFPESKFRGKKIESITRLIDVLPTVLEELDVNFSGLEIEGQSLIPLLKGKKVGDRTFLADIASNILNSHIPQKITMNLKGDKLILNRQFSQEDLDFFLSPPPHTSSVEFYDLDKDPFEKKNRAAEKSKLISQLTQQINEIYKNAKKRKTGKAEIDEKLKEQLRALGYIR